MTRVPRDPRDLPPDGDHGAECRWPPRPWFDKRKGGPGNPGTPEFCPPTAITVPSADGRRARGSTRNRVTRIPRDPHTRHPGDPETPAPSPGESAQYAAYRLQQSIPTGPPDRIVMRTREGHLRRAEASGAVRGPREST